MSEPAIATFDVSAATFEKEVIERSRKTPVLVDFWATWCQPCRALSPVLEKLAEEAKGAFTLAKVDIDRSPELADAFGIQSVPTVALVKDGKFVDGFMGAQPEAKIREMLGRHGALARDVVAEALELERAGKTAEAIARLRLHAKDERDAFRARAQLARLLALTGKMDEARALLERLPESERESEAARAARALVGVVEHAGNLSELERAVTANPDDVAARLKLGRALLAAQKMEAALAELYEAARRDIGFQGGEPRKALQEAFTALSDEHPLVNEYRRKLSVLLCG